MKAIQSEIKQNVQGTNSDEKETGTQINDLDQKEEINIQAEQNGETRIQKKQREYKMTLGHLQKCQHPNYRDGRRRGRARN